MRSLIKSLASPAFMIAVLAVALVAGAGMNGFAQQETLRDIADGVVPPTACRVGGVTGLNQFTSTGFSTVRTAMPNQEVVAGAWSIVNNFRQNTSVTGTPNCAVTGALDGQGLNLFAVRVTPTTVSWQDADIEQLKLVVDLNRNGQWEPLQDQQIGQLDGSSLESMNGAVFYNGPQSPLAFLANNNDTDASGNCSLGDTDAAAPAPGQGTSTVAGANGCSLPLLVVAKVGSEPTVNSMFGLELEALAGDLPGSTTTSSFTISSGFEGTQNPVGSNVRMQIIGGNPTSGLELEHLSNASGNPESDAKTVNFTGGENGNGLKSRFRAEEITPGTREAVAIAVGVCDGGDLVNTNASVLPQIAGAPPTIAGGIGTLTCVPSTGTDGFATGINGATLAFRGPLAEYMGTVRMYVDECSVTGSAAPNNFCAAPGGGAVAAPTTVSDAGGGDGILFQSGELVQAKTPVYNENTGEAVVRFGPNQGQVLFTGNGSVVAAGSDQQSAVANNPGTAPLLMIFTVDIDDDAPGGEVDVAAALQTFDDTAQNRTTGGGGNPCNVFAATAPTAPNLPGAAAGTCASNISVRGPATNTFEVMSEGDEQPATGAAQYDTNGNGVIDDNEFMAAIDDWIAGDINDSLFFDVLNAWVDQTSVGSAGVSGLSLSSVNLSSSANGTTFAVSGQGVANTSVEVFSLDGSTVFNQTTAGSTLSWNHTASNGQPVANGVYLYRVTVEGADGNTVTSDVKKLVVVR